MIIKNHEMVRDDWMTKVYKWMGIPEKVINVIIKLIEGWKARLEAMINIRNGFWLGDSFSLVGFCLT